MSDRYCTSCGDPLQGDARFCTSCGAPASSAPAGQDAAPATPPTPASAAVPATGAPRKGKRGLAAAIVVAVLLIAIAVLLAAVRPWEAPHPSGSAISGAGSSSSAASSSASNAASSDSSGSSGSRPGSTLSPSASTVSGSALGFDSGASIDLNEAGRLHAVNLFLSNFTETGPLMNGYTFDGSPDIVLADFSAAHIYINNPESLREGAGPGTWEVQQDVFSRCPSVFLKRSLPDIRIGASPVGPYAVFEGSVNLLPERVPTTAQGVAYATSSRDAGNGRTEVAFDIYYGGPYDALDEALYNGSLDELRSRLGVSAPIATGTAVIEPYDDGSVAPFKLWSYESTR